MQEVLINGVLRGRKQTDPRGASSISRIKIWQMTRASLKVIALPTFVQLISAKTYKSVKQSQLLEQRRQVKADTKLEAVKGWIPNVDDDFETGPE